jgi:death-on-curing protein
VSDIRYTIGREEVIAIHQRTVEVSGGGVLGIINLGSIEAALDHIQNDLYYPTFADKLTHLFYAANRGHCFQDGNKRIAIALGMKFLIENGHVLIVQRFAERMEMITYHVAAGRIDKELLCDIVHSILNEEDYSIDLKLRIAQAINEEE